MYWTCPEIATILVSYPIKILHKNSLTPALENQFPTFSTGCVLAAVSRRERVKLIMRIVCGTAH